MYVNRDINSGAKKLIWASVILLIIGTQLDAMTITATIGVFGAEVSESQGLSYGDLQNPVWGELALDSNALVFWYIGIIAAIASAIMVNSKHPQAKIVAFAGPILALISLFQVYTTVSDINNTFGGGGSYYGISGELSFDPGPGPIVGFVGVILGLIGAAKIKTEGVAGTQTSGQPVYQTQPAMQPQYPQQTYQQQPYQQQQYQQPPQQPNYNQPPQGAVNPPPSSPVNPPPVSTSGDQFCPECGTKNDGEATFCGNCGSKI